MNTAGTNKTFRLEFLQFDHEHQRWRAECLIGEERITIAGAAGHNRWYVIDHPEIVVPHALEVFLARSTVEALADYKKLKEYKNAVGEYPAGLLQ